MRAAMQVQNSELQKALWEDFSLHRIIAMPVVIALIAGTFILSESSESANHNIQNMAYMGFYTIAILWGTYQSAHAIPKEVTNNTWDNLRLSPISPWSLVLGKLFGSTLYQWYGALILLAIYCVTASNFYPVSEVFSTVCCMLGVALVCQSLGMLGTMLPLRKQEKSKRLPAFGGFVASLLVSSLFYGPLTTIFYKSESATLWYGIHVPGSVLLSSVLCISLFWIYCALYRIMREALQFKNMPTVWTGFVVFLMVYFAGFLPHNAFFGRVSFQQLPISSCLLLASIIGLVLTYLNFFTDNLSFVRYRSFLNAIHQRKWHPCFHTMPLWMISMSLGSIAAIIVAGLTLVSGSDKTSWLVLSSILFVLRDSGIFHYFYLAPKGRLPHFAALFYLLLLYGLIPSLCHLMWIREFAYAFFPNVDFPLEGDVINLISITLQLAVVSFLVKKRYQRLAKQTEQNASV
jgi:hypothetical protein